MQKSKFKKRYEFSAVLKTQNEIDMLEGTIDSTGT